MYFSSTLIRWSRPSPLYCKRYTQYKRIIYFQQLQESCIVHRPSLFPSCTTPISLSSARCADAMVPRRRHASTSSTPPDTTVAPGGGGVRGREAVGASGLTTERRAVAVARCMSAGEGCRSEHRSKAVLALANAASFPFSAGLRDLVQVTRRRSSSWGRSRHPSRDAYKSPR